MKSLSKLMGIIVLSLISAAAMAQRGDADDPSSRVARLAYAQGSVSLQPAGTEDWVSPSLNRPVTTGDKLWSDRDGRVELQLDDSVVRLSNDTGMSFLNVSDNVTQIELSAGTLLVHVRRLDDDQTYEIDTPNLAFSILRPGVYRVNVDDQGYTTDIAVRSGEGEVTGGGYAYPVRARERYSFTGTDQLAANALQYDTGNDQFGAWSANRDNRWEHSESARYVSPDVVGYEDLDDYGSWRPTPEYGNVWYPRSVQAGWAPYHSGYWAYIEPWGYTWVDDEPWGFAPFHYGRWVFVGGSWGWVPSPPRTVGVAYVRPVYAPALVAWTSIGGGGVAWFALGPREVYVPSYSVSRTYVNRINVSNTTVNTTVVNNYYNTTIVNRNVNVTNVRYVNRNVPGSVTATTSQAFTTAQPVARNAVRVDQRVMASAPVRAVAPPAVPAKQAVLGAGRGGAARPPAAVQTRAVVAKVAPPPPPPTFERHQEAIKNNGGKPLTMTQVRQIQPAAAQRPAPVRIAPPARPQNAQGNRPAAPVTTQPENRQGEPPTTVNQPAQPPGRGNNAARRPDNRPPEQPAAANSEVNQPAQPRGRGNNADRRPDNRPPEQPATANSEANQPAQPPGRAAAPSNAAPPSNNRPADRPANANNGANKPPTTARSNERPPAAKTPPPASTANAPLEQKHQQEQQQLHAQQDRERKNLRQNQEVERQRTGEARKQQVEQQHQQQSQQLQQRQAQEQEQLQKKQQEENQQQDNKKPSKKPKNDRPPEEQP